MSRGQGTRWGVAATNPCWDTRRLGLATASALVAVSQETRPRVCPGEGGPVGTVAA